MRRCGWYALTLAAGLSIAAAAGAAQVQFAFDYGGDAAGEGFNDPALGAARRNALQAAANLWSNRLTASYAGETILVHAVFDPLGGSSTSATLGFASGAGADVDFGSASPKYLPSTVYVSAQVNHLFGSDRNGSTPEINATFNSTVDTGTIIGGERWYYGSDSNPGGNIDFITVALHELAHGLGFGASINETGAFLNGEDLPDAFDRHLYVSSTPGNPNNFLTARDQGTRADDVVGDNLYFNGPDSQAGNGGALVKLYAPTTWQTGSSVSHVNDATYPTDIMDHSYPAANHTLSPIDLGILSDVGWDITPVPEPAGLALVGVAALMLVRRRRA